MPMGGRKPHIFCGLRLGGASRYLLLSAIAVIFLRQWRPKGLGSRCGFPFFSPGSAQAEVRFFYFFVFVRLPTLAFCFSCGGNRNQEPQLWANTAPLWEGPAYAISALACV